MKKYDVIIIGAGPGGIFSAYELLKITKIWRSPFLRKDMHWKKENVRLMARRSKAAFTARAVRS